MMVVMVVKTKMKKTLFALGPFFLSLLGLSASSLANMNVVQIIYDLRLIFLRFRHMSCKRSFDEFMLFQNQ